jgi:uncharacterized protein YjbJ (UPF0337 family)
VSVRNDHDRRLATLEFQYIWASRRAIAELTDDFLGSSAMLQTAPTRRSPHAAFEAAGAGEGETEIRRSALIGMPSIARGVLMTDPEARETTAGGVVGRVVGKAKSAVGSLVGNEDLQREGNLQQARVEAEADAERETQTAELRSEEAAVVAQRAEAVAERDRLRAEIASEDRQEQLHEQEVRREESIATAASREQIAVQRREQAEKRAVDASESAALERRSMEAAEIARLRAEADQAARAADSIDPETR